MCQSEKAVLSSIIWFSLQGKKKKKPLSLKETNYSFPRNTKLVSGKFFQWYALKRERGQ